MKLELGEGRKGSGQGTIVEEGDRAARDRKIMCLMSLNLGHFLGHKKLCATSDANCGTICATK